ncbi:MAG TPA: hypothetical protein PKI61_02000 [bacterium]|nr:hypothetical protein [bacterium]HPT29637.1 hypothetical protein [bacterium]
MNAEIVRKALELVTPAIENLLATIAKRNTVHVIIMDATKKPWEAKFEDAVLAEKTFGDRNTWERKYDEVARGKAKQGWRIGDSNFALQELGPAGIRPGEVLYVGGFNYQGQLVFCSGVESYFDTLISGWIALAIQQLSRHELERIKSLPGFDGFMK